MQELRDRVAVVTGGASGIGLGMARAFAEQGMKLALADVEPAALEKAVKALRDEGAQAVGVECDVSKQASLEVLRDRTLSEYGAVHVLCNNAGVGGSEAGAVWESSQGEWDWVVGVNLFGVVYGTRVFVPVMIEQGGPGHVVNTASMAGLIHGGGIYGVTKHAVVAFSESLWSQLKARGLPIGASVLCPGWVRTRIMESERNRPEAPRPDAGARAAEFEMIRKVMTGFVEGGMDPLEVGRLVTRAVQEERFYILSHPSWVNMIRHRAETVCEGRDPVPVPPEGDEGIAKVMEMMSGD
jgi:NAD(P)-dependent dehydrogenase (short-subunit alcohol dehydrogenase family)